MGLSHKDALRVYDALTRKWAELTLKELGQDLARIEDYDTASQLYLRAYWTKLCDLMMDINEVLKRTEDRNERLGLVLEMFSDQLDIPSSSLKVDVSARLDWLKRRTAKEFEREVKRVMDRHGVTSPIEQIFLMEWKFARVEENLGVKLLPQERVPTKRGAHAVDFLVVPVDGDKHGARVAIELDGHQFHEKTPTQATRDRAQDRAMLRSGVRVLRFTGTEIVRDARRCIQEVIEFLEAKSE